MQYEANQRPSEEIKWSVDGCSTIYDAVLFPPEDLEEIDTEINVGGFN